jgi:hypothetical protein
MLRSRLAVGLQTLNLSTVVRIRPPEHCSLKN